MIRSASALIGTAALSMFVLSACGGEPVKEAAMTVTATATVTATVTTTVTAKPTPPPAPPKPKPKPTIPSSFGDGTYVVGEDVQPGTYRNDGSVYGDQAPCVAFASREPNDIQTFIRSSDTSGPGILKLNAGEYVNVTGCLEWSLDR